MTLRKRRRKPIDRVAVHHHMKTLCQAYADLYIPGKDWDLIRRRALKALENLRKAFGGK